MKKLITVLGLTAFLPCALIACAPEEIRALRSAHRVVAGEILSVERVAKDDRRVTYSIEAVVRKVLLGSPMEENSIRVRMDLWGPKADPSYEKGKSYVLYLRKEPADPKAGEEITWSVDYGLTSIQADTESLRSKLGPNNSGKDRSYKASHDGVDVDALSPLERKMHSIIIPEMDFMCANIYDIIDCLHMASVDFDRSSPVDQKGVNICLNGRSFTGDRMPLINFYSEDMSLLQALDLVVGLADGERTTIDDWIIVSRKGADSPVASVELGDGLKEAGTERVLESAVLEEIDFRQAAIGDVARYLSDESGVTISVSEKVARVEDLGPITLTGGNASTLTVLKLLTALLPVSVRIEGISAIISSPAPSSQSASGGPVVGHLKTRDKVITIRTGTAGPLYTVKSEDGTILAVDLTQHELSAKFPDLKRVVEGGIADWAGTTGHMSIEIPR